MENQTAVITQKIQDLTIALSTQDRDDRLTTINQIRRLEHKLNEINGVENSCDIDEDGSCLSCSG